MAGSIYDWSTTAGTNASADGDINWTEGQLPSTVNDSARTMMKRVAEWVKDHGALTLSGTDTLTVTANSAFTAYATGRTIIAKVANDNTSTTVTLNVNSIGAKRVKIIGRGGELDPQAGDLQAGMYAHFVYDAAGNSAAGSWVLLNPANKQIGVDVQAYDADLAAIAALTSAANKVPYATGAQAWALADFTTTGRAIVAATVTADQILYGNGANTVTTATLTTAGRDLIDDADAAAQRTTLGLGTVATQTYTEGTFTPAIAGTSTAGTGTYVSNGQIGRYTRIGRICFISIYLEWTAHTGTGNLQITGLPFNSANVTGYEQMFPIMFSSLDLDAGALGYESIAGYITPNATNIAMRQLGDNLGEGAIPMDTAARIRLTGVYEIA